MTAAHGYACPHCGSYLRQDPEKKPGWLYCHCGFQRKTLQEEGKVVPPKTTPEEPVKTRRKAR